MGFSLCFYGEGTWREKGKLASKMQHLEWRYAKCYGRWRHFPDAASGKELPANAGDVRDMGSIPESGRSLGRWHGNPLQYSCLESPMDRGAWLATDHRVAKSWTWLRWLSMQGRRLWCWERLKAGEGDDRGWDGWMASLTQWTWVWASSGSWW